MDEEEKRGRTQQAGTGDEDAMDVAVVAQRASPS